MTGTLADLAHETRLALVVGPPGTGKTTFVSRQIAEATGKGREVLVASLTKAAARELAGRDLPIDARRIGTLHSHAFHAMGGGEVAEKHAREWNDWLGEKGHPIDWRLSVTRKRTLDDPHDESAGDDENDGQKTPGDGLLELIGTYRARMLDADWWPAVEPRLFCRAWSAWKHETGYVDFTDMIETCVREKLTPVVGFDALFVDEAQDSSRLETTLALQWGAAADVLVICGDPRQNLYEWRGSEPEVFLELDRIASDKRVLSRSYRVPRAVHARAVEWASQLSRDVEAVYHPREADGSVERGWSLRDVEQITDEAAQISERGQTVMLLAATKRLADLFVVALRAIGATFHNPYRPQMKRWNPLGDGKTSAGQQLLAFSRVNTDVWNGEARFWTTDEIAAWVKPIQAERVFKRGAKGRLTVGASVSDDEFISLIRDEAMLEPILSGDIAWYRSMLTPAQERQGRCEYPAAIVERHGVQALAAEPRITVGTIHSVKGGEADVVYVAPDLSPAGYDTYQDSGARDQTIRLMYVAMTRARETLVLCAPMGSRAVEWL
jgi:DNA helicase-2/ATP-dependent DNA helicase PcrA